MQLKTGTTLQNGKYRITRILGQGGFGITYEAEQSGLNRMVALKEFFMKDCCERHPDSTLVFVPTKNNRELVEKFRGKFIREAQMIAAFDHPYIVRVLEVFEENGTAYYVMNRVPGGSLKDRVLASGPLPETEALGYIRQVADALAYVHARNTVHLDIKPSNILLNDRNEVILIDFGISKHYDSSGEQTSSTPVGLSKGFSPLEQRLDGDVRQFGPSTDIYALGATLYYLVSGLEPPEASLAAENGVPRPEGVSDLLWNVIEQSMKPFRKNRPQDIPAFLALLPRQRPETPGGEERRERKGNKTDETVIVDDAGTSKWVDLGLPSGTLWKDGNEKGSFTYEEALKSFGSQLPLYEQWVELKDRCRWFWTGKGFKVFGPNGQFIMLPAQGWRGMSGLVFGKDVYGGYWSSTPASSIAARYLDFSAGHVAIFSNNRTFALSVRLVRPRM